MNFKKYYNLYLHSTLLNSKSIVRISSYMITLLNIPHDEGLIKDRNKTMQAKFPNNNASFLGDNINAKVCVDLWQDMSKLRPSLNLAR